MIRREMDMPCNNEVIFVHNSARMIADRGPLVNKSVVKKREPQFMGESRMAEPKMNCPSESKSASCDEPLFVLKYRSRKIIRRLILFFIPFYIIWFALFHENPPLLMKVVCVLTLSIFGSMFLDILFFREVRLYEDRMVKIWNFLGKTEVTLADARLRCTAVAIGKAGPHNKYMCMSNRQTNLVWSSILGVTYDEMLADPDDVKKLNTLLADLTGRRVEEFEQPRIRIDRLIQEGGR